MGIRSNKAGINIVYRPCQKKKKKKRQTTPTTKKMEICRTATFARNVELIWLTFWEKARLRSDRKTYDSFMEFGLLSQSRKTKTRLHALVLLTSCGNALYFS